MSYAYTNSGSDHATSKERKSIEFVATLLGLTVDEWRSEVPGSEVTITHLLSVLGAGSILFISSPSALSHQPRRMIELAAKLIGAGVRIVVADQPSFRFDLEGLRANLAPMTVLEEKVKELTQRLIDQEEDHASEYASYQQIVEKTLMDGLASRGIGLAHLLKGGAVEASSVAPRPDLGRQLRETREKLGYTQEFAGTLVKSPLSKSAVSKLEAAGSSEPRYAEYSEALQIEYIVKNEAKKKLARGIDPNPELNNFKPDERTKALRANLVAPTTPTSTDDDPNQAVLNQIKYGA